MNNSERTRIIHLQRKMMNSFSERERIGQTLYFLNEKLNSVKTPSLQKKIREQVQQVSKMYRKLTLNQEKNMKNYTNLSKRVWKSTHPNTPFSNLNFHRFWKRNQTMYEYNKALRLMNQLPPIGLRHHIGKYLKN